MRETRLHVKPTKVKGETYWQLTVPKAGGGRVRKTFKDKKDADAALREAKFQLRSHGVEAASMSGLLRTQALEADRILQPYSVSILDIAREYVTSRQAADKSCTVEQAVREFIAGCEREGKSARYLRDLKSRLGKFTFQFGTFKMSDVTTSQIDNWLHDQKTLGPVARNTLRLRLNVLYNHGIGRDWCTKNPVAKVGVSKEPESPIGILTVE